MYCLRCFTRVERTAKHCLRCGMRNDRHERKLYWNRAPKLIFLESVLKFLAVAVSIGLLVVIMTGLPIPGPHTNHGSSTSGWFYVTPLLLGFAMWKTASRLTHHGRYFGPVAFWMALLGLVGAALLLGGSTKGASLCALGCAAVYTLGSLGNAWKARLTRGS